MPPTMVDARFPASSMQLPVADWDAPCMSRVVEEDDESTPERASVHVNETVTLTLFHPNKFAGGDLVPLMTGLVRSTLILVSVVLAGLPARSKHVPVADWPAASPSVVEGETLNTPESTSVHAKLTVTATLFQPLALGCTDLLLVTIGLVRSTLMLVSEMLAEFPA